MITLMDKYTIIKLKLTGMSNREIARKLEINRKTVSKYWKEYQNENNKLTTNANVKEIQEKIVSKPKYDTSSRKTYKYSEEIDSALDQILESEKEKLRLLGINKQQLSNIQIHQELLALGFNIGKTTISTKIREKRQRSKECFIRQVVLCQEKGQLKQGNFLHLET